MWCDDHKIYRSDDWKYVIWSGESSFLLFPTSGRVYAWRTLKEAYTPKCLVPTVKHGGGSGMIWAATSRYSAGHIITLNGRITASDHVGNRVLPMIQMLFPDNGAVFQDDSPYTHSQKDRVLV